MGNQNTRETRPGFLPQPSTAIEPPVVNPPAQASSRNRQSRADLSLFGFSTANLSRPPGDEHFEHKETRVEREARRLERERFARGKERERSVRDEHVDGGYLVTLGTYTGTEDFNKSVVRQLQIQRRLAPFWRGLHEISSQWTDKQLLAAAKGRDSRDLHLHVQGRADSSIAGKEAVLIDEIESSLARPSSRGSSSDFEDISRSLPTRPSVLVRSSTSFRPKSKTLSAVLNVGARSSSSKDLSYRSPEISPQEIQLPPNPYVNGERLEVVLYKTCIECPICFLTYPPYLNLTRCCHQPICSECFVQIKRPDPHFPDFVKADAGKPENVDQDPADVLVAEPSTCPYCQQPNFGVIYSPPAFRRGLVYATDTSICSSSGGIYSSELLRPITTSSTPSPSTDISQAPGLSRPSGRQRNASVSANSPNVITTDMIRPEWDSKLAAARSHQAKRSAAATALHTAAFIIGTSEHRSFSFRHSRFSRRITPYFIDNVSDSTITSSHIPIDGTQGPEPGQRVSSVRNPIRSSHNPMDELEDMMFLEAVRLSLVSEEERKRKEEKENRKEVRTRLMEERKSVREQQKQPDPIDVENANGQFIERLGQRQARSDTDRGIGETSSIVGSHSAVYGSSGSGVLPVKGKETQGADDTAPENVRHMDYGSSDSSNEETSVSPASDLEVLLSDRRTEHAGAKIGLESEAASPSSGGRS